MLCSAGAKMRHFCHNFDPRKTGIFQVRLISKSLSQRASSEASCFREKRKPRSKCGKRVSWSLFFEVWRLQTKEQVLNSTGNDALRAASITCRLMQAGYAPPRSVQLDHRKVVIRVRGCRLTKTQVNLLVVDIRFGLNAKFCIYLPRAWANNIQQVLFGRYKVFLKHVSYATIVLTASELAAAEKDTCGKKGRQMTYLVYT